MIREDVQEKWINKLKALLYDWRAEQDYHECLRCVGFEGKILEAIEIIEAEEVGDSWADG